MNQRRAGLFAALLIGVLVSASLISYVNAAGSGQNDANKGRDAPDSRNGAPDLIVPGRYQGQLVSGTDTEDWYRVGPKALQVRPTVEIFVQSLTGNNNLEVELYTTATSLTPAATATGGNGAWGLQRQFTGELFLKVGLADANQGGTTGKYEFVISRHDDGDNANPDAGDNTQTSAAGSIQLTGGRATIEGQFAPGDRTDVYTFTTPEGTDEVLAGVHFTPTAVVKLAVAPTSSPGSTIPSTSRAGSGFATAYQTGLASDTDVWTVTVSRDAATTEQALSYTLSIVTNPNVEDPDVPAEDTDRDAAGDWGGAAPLSQGIHRGFMEISQGDNRDVYRLQGVVVGQVISIGASSHEGDTDLARPYLGLILRNPGGSEAARVAPCNGAAGITQTALQPGDWFLEVIEQGGVSPCGGNANNIPNRDNEYSLSYRLRFQQDNGDADAPLDNAAAPGVPTPVDSDDKMVSTWMDSVDVSDTYTLSTLTAGETVRVGATTDVPGLEYNLYLFRGATLLASSASTAGTARLNVAVGTQGEHFIRFAYRTPTTGTLPLGLIEYYAVTAENEAPTAVTLSEISKPATGGGDVTRNAVTLRWTRAVDDDFARYEINAGVTSGYTPSSVTLKETITNRDDNETTVTGLSQDTDYHFLVRVVDSSGLFADSNRRTVSTRSGPLGNTAPTLAGGGVSPSSGSTSTLFKFQVNYTDADNDPPQLRRVVVSGVQHDMTTPATSPNYANGVFYQFETTINTPGTKDFFFQFSDGVTGGDARDPPGAGAHTGPSVTQSGNRPPNVAASATPTEGDAPLDVQFDVTATDPDGDALQYCWDFNTANGIQCNSSQKAPEHTYTTRGAYTASVFVTDSKGSSSSDSVTINVKGSNNEPPTVDATAQPTEGEVELTVQFRSNAVDSDGTIASYKWDFDNSDGLGQDSTEANPTHTYKKAGSFVATVTVTDNGTASTVDSVTVVVRSADNAPPSVLVSGDPVEGGAPLVVNFTATVADADGDAVTVRWDFDTSDGFGIDATGLVASHTYTDEGEFNAMAIATDSKGATATGTTKIRVLGGSGGGVIIQAEPTSGKAPLAVSFKADTSELGTTATDYSWDFGDGATGTGKEIIHTYEKSGSYGVILVVADESGGTYESTITIRVQGGGSPGLGSAFAIALVVAVAFVLHRRRQGPK